MTIHWQFLLGDPQSSQKKHNICMWLESPKSRASALTTSLMLRMNGKVCVFLSWAASLILANFLDTVLTETETFLQNI